jgi:hypothetical protein
MAPLRKRMLEEVQLRNLSEATIRAYLGTVTRFAQHFGKSPEQLGPEQVRQYLLHLINDKKDTCNTLQVYRGALKFLYVRVLKQSWFDLEIAAPKRRLRLPTVLSSEEIARILDRTSNLKHWTGERAEVLLGTPPERALALTVDLEPGPAAWGQSSEPGIASGRGPAVGVGQSGSPRPAAPAASSTIARASVVPDAWSVPSSEFRSSHPMLSRFPV